MTARPTRRRNAGIAAAAVLLLCVGYPASFGPIVYSARRGWLPLSAQNAFIPVLRLQNAPVVDRPYAAYLLWWWRLAPDDPDPQFLPPLSH